MEQIINFNCAGKCNHKYCDNNYEFFVEIQILDISIMLPLCKQHAEEFDNKYFNFLKEGKCLLN
jgi:hypothetical protein